MVAVYLLRASVASLKYFGARHLEDPLVGRENGGERRESC